MSVIKNNDVVNSILDTEKNKLLLRLLDERMLYENIKEVKEFLDNNSYMCKFDYYSNALNTAIYKNVPNFYSKLRIDYTLTEEEISNIIKHYNRGVWTVKNY